MQEGKRKVTQKTLFYMPHCTKPLYSNVLWANWCPSGLSNVFILGNSFAHYSHRYPKIVHCSELIIFVGCCKSPVRLNMIMLIKYLLLLLLTLSICLNMKDNTIYNGSNITRWLTHGRSIQWLKLAFVWRREIVKKSRFMEGVYRTTPICSWWPRAHWCKPCPFTQLKPIKGFFCLFTY